MKLCKIQTNLKCSDSGLHLMSHIFNKMIGLFFSLLLQMDFLQQLFFHSYDLILQIMNFPFMQIFLHNF